ncbi:glycoside hydrolase family 13 protein [Infundibulicybe gibba]|nr:glycoside hydrolase family 13 protein [Infundibulicybe gibba]
MFPFLLLALALAPKTVFAATAEQWRSRSIYQIITDRFAIPSETTNPTACDPGQQTWCGGTWNSIRENLDYVQNAGFTAIWISPVNQNYEGPRTAYGDAYHGYWIADASQLNPRFGTADDLKALSDELHRRNMYLMVDVVVNNYMFKDQSLYHPYCPIQWGNTTSEQNCWLGDDKVPLPDLDTKNPAVVSQYETWVQKLVQDYNIDGLRIDAGNTPIISISFSRHVNMDFWPGFCAKAGVFCIGEVFGGIDVDSVAQYQGPQSLDSVLHFPMYTALTAGFKIPGPQNISAVVDTMQQSKAKFKDIGLLGNFLENQDLPRWHNQSVDPQSLYNAMVMNFMMEGIPIVYYGQEQGFSGSGDPYNREPLWPSKYAKTDAYGLIATLNQLRNFLVNTTDWLSQESQILTQSPYGLGFMRGDVITVVTNIGSPPQNGTHIALSSPYPASTSTTNILDCRQWAVGAKGFLDVEYTKGGAPVVLVLTTVLENSGFCGTVRASQGGVNAGKQPSSTLHLRTQPLLVGAAALGIAFALGVI